MNKNTPCFACPEMEIFTGDRKSIACFCHKNKTFLKIMDNKKLEYVRILKDKNCRKNENRLIATKEVI